MFDSSPSKLQFNDFKESKMAHITWIVGFLNLVRKLVYCWNSISKITSSGSSNYFVNTLLLESQRTFMSNFRVWCSVPKTSQRGVKSRVFNAPFRLFSLTSCASPHQERWLTICAYAYQLLLWKFMFEKEFKHGFHNINCFWSRP